MSTNKLGSKIKALRKKSKMSQTKLAEKVGVLRITIGKWENGEVVPPTEMITAFSLIFGVTTDYLIFDDVDYELSTVNMDDDEYNLLVEILTHYKEKNENFR